MDGWKAVVFGVAGWCGLVRRVSAIWKAACSACGAAAAMRILARVAAQEILFFLHGAALTSAHCAGAEPEFISGYVSPSVRHHSPFWALGPDACMPTMVHLCHACICKRRHVPGDHPPSTLSLALARPQASYCMELHRVQHCRTEKCSVRPPRNGKKDVHFFWSVVVVWWWCGAGGMLSASKVQFRDFATQRRARLTMSVLTPTPMHSIPIGNLGHKTK